MKFMINRMYLTILLLAVSLVVSGQGALKGRVTESEGGRVVEGANVTIGGARGTATDADGRFYLGNIPSGRLTVEVSVLGYKLQRFTVEVPDKETLSLEVTLEPSFIEAREVVISATRTENFINDVPTRVNLVSSGIIRATPALTVDDYLTLVPGINISRSFGIYSHKSNVTMRGLSGKEQARVLVMIDGVPVNKSDGGSVNWNLLDPDMIDRIEVVKGPSSAVYGSNAMGGAINVITMRPSGRLKTKIKAGYGTYNTLTGRVSLSQRLAPDSIRGFYYALNGLYRSSDGYITQSVYDQQANPYIVPSNLMELSGGIKAGYDFSENEKVEIDLSVYDDERGTGELVHMPNGNTTDHDTYQFRARYDLKHNRLATDVSIFWLRENYKKVNEYMKDDYTWYNVLSERTDAGLLSSVSYTAGKNHTLSTGIDLRLGSVDASDVYYTSTDIVYNRGRMFSGGIYAQDEMRLLDERLRVVAGLRFDVSYFFDGAFYIETPSAETSFMRDIEDQTIDNALWNALSPRLSVNYSLSSDARIYASFGRGFRPSVLDDLCRSGRMKGGFKLANPLVNPEYLTSVEAGGDIILNRNMRASLSAYYSIGKDFLYYVNTGDSIEMGYGLRPIYVSTNIPEVRITGIEAELNYTPRREIAFTAAYGLSHSFIKKYEPLDASDPIDLTGNYLTDVPGHSASLSVRWTNRIVNASLAGRYQGTMWVNDLNLFDDIVGADRYPDYVVIDLRLSKVIGIVTADLGVQNLLDKKFYDSKAAVCPGRFITLDLGLVF